VSATPEDVAETCSHARECESCRVAIKSLVDRLRRAEDRLALELDRQIAREQNRLENLKEMRRLADESDYFIKDIVNLAEPVRSRTP
jgi:hypothetical protein